VFSTSLESLSIKIWYLINNQNVGKKLSKYILVDIECKEIPVNVLLQAKFYITL